MITRLGDPTHSNFSKLNFIQSLCWLDLWALWAGSMCWLCELVLCVGSLCGLMCMAQCKPLNDEGWQTFTSSNSSFCSTPGFHCLDGLCSNQQQSMFNDVQRSWNQTWCVCYFFATFFLTFFLLLELSSNTILDSLVTPWMHALIHALTLEGCSKQSQAI